MHNPIVHPVKLALLMFQNYARWPQFNSSIQVTTFYMQEENTFWHGIHAMNSETNNHCPWLIKT